MMRRTPAPRSRAPWLAVGACACAMVIAPARTGAAQDVTVPPAAPVETSPVETTASAEATAPLAASQIPTSAAATLPAGATVVPIDLDASPTTAAASSSSDEPADRRIRRIVLGLTGIGLVMVLVTVLYWRATRPVDPLLANLATIDSRRFRRASAEQRAAMLQPHPMPPDAAEQPASVVVDLPPAEPLPPLVEPAEVPPPADDLPVPEDVGSETPALEPSLPDSGEVPLVAGDAPDPSGAPVEPSGSVSSDG